MVFNQFSNANGWRTLHAKDAGTEAIKSLVSPPRGYVRFNKILPHVLRCVQANSAAYDRVSVKVQFQDYGIMKNLGTRDSVLDSSSTLYAVLYLYPILRCMLHYMTYSEQVHIQKSL